MNFVTCPASVNEILQLISQVPLGRQTVSQFMPSFQSGKVRIESYPPEVVRRMRELLGPDQPIGACFVNDEDAGTIYLDLSAPLGVLAPFLFHEIIHSLDPELWRAARFPQTRKSRDELMLETETRAFDLQHRFVTELKERFPEYKEFLAGQMGRIRVLSERLTRDDIAHLYKPKAS